MCREIPARSSVLSRGKGNGKSSSYGDYAKVKESGDDDSGSLTASCISREEIFFGLMLTRFGRMTLLQLLQHVNRSLGHYRMRIVSVASGIVPRESQPAGIPTSNMGRKIHDIISWLFTSQGPTCPSDYIRMPSVSSVPHM